MATKYQPPHHIYRQQSTTAYLFTRGILVSQLLKEPDTNISLPPLSHLMTAGILSFFYNMQLWV